MTWRVFTVLALLAPLNACAAAPASLLEEAGGAVSQTLCSKTFISGISPETAYAEHLRPQPGMGLIDWSVHYDVDRINRQVRTRVAGGVERTSVYAEGRGCTILYPDIAPPAPLSALAHTPALLPDIAGTDRVVTRDPGLQRALDAAFAEPARGTPRATKAVVIIHNDHVIAEQYAQGYTVGTPVISHSIAKSVISSLVGVLVRDGLLDIHKPAPVMAWQNDPRRAITIDNLLRMTAGFGFDEGNGSSIATQIWYTKADGAAAAAAATASAAPGAAWGYSSRSYMLLSRIVADAVGGTPQAMHDFAQRALFDPLGMQHVTMEFDASGNAMGAHAMFATPRDWARLGMLYLDDGVVGGTRILPEGWVRFVTTPSGEAGYGAGFWLNTTDAEIGPWHMKWGIPGAPRNAFMARGYLGQYVVVVPSANLVVARFGVSHGRNGEIASVGALVRDVIAITSAGKTG